MLIDIVLSLLLLHSSSGEAGCTCTEAKLHHGWCEAHDVGYIAGVKIESEIFWETLDAHGHPVDRASLTCEVCTRAIDQGGFCWDHRRGFVHGEAYHSRLTYYLAKGETKNVSTIECPDCRKHAESFGWCDEHDVGMVGNVAITNEEDFERASKSFKVLLSAIELAETCELCGASMATDGRCPVHNLYYKDGVASETPP